MLHRDSRIKSVHPLTGIPKTSPRAEQREPVSGGSWLSHAQLSDHGHGSSPSWDLRFLASKVSKVLSGFKFLEPMLP